MKDRVSRDGKVIVASHAVVLIALQQRIHFGFIRTARALRASWPFQGFEVLAALRVVRAKLFIKFDEIHFHWSHLSA
jgi:hypothetical protein